MFALHDESRKMIFTKKKYRTLKLLKEYTITTVDKCHEKVP